MRRPGVGGHRLYTGWDQKDLSIAQAQAAIDACFRSTAGDHALSPTKQPAVDCVQSRSSSACDVAMAEDHVHRLSGGRDGAVGSLPQGVYDIRLKFPNDRAEAPQGSAVEHPRPPERGNVY